jgi:hypothetical protein
MVTGSCKSIRLANLSPEGDSVSVSRNVMCDNLARYMIRGRNGKSLSYLFSPGPHFRQIRVYCTFGLVAYTGLKPSLYVGTSGPLTLQFTDATVRPVCSYVLVASLTQNVCLEFDGPLDVFNVSVR